MIGIWRVINFERIIPLGVDRAVFDVEFEDGDVLSGLEIHPLNGDYELRNATDLPLLVRDPVREVAVIEMRNRPHFDV